MIGRRTVDPMVRGSLRPEGDWHSNGHHSNGHHSNGHHSNGHAAAPAPSAPSGAFDPSEGFDPSAGFDAWDELRREIARSRRYGHEFVLIRIPHGGSPAPRRSRWSRSRRSRDFARALRSLVRTLDRVWTSNGSLYLLLPESNRAAGESLLGRLREAAPELLPDYGIRLAAFPADGLTSGALLETLGKSKENGALGDVRESAHLASLPPREGEGDDGRMRVPALEAGPSVELGRRSMAHAQGG
jgi:hypothetical protein